MKKCLLLMLACMILSVTAWAGGGKDSAAQGTSASGSGVVKDKFTLNVNTNQKGPDELAQIDAGLVRYKQKYPNATINIDYGVTFSNWGDYATRLMTQFASGEKIDILWIAIEGIAPLASNGVIVPLDKYINADAGLKNWIGSLIPAALGCMQWKGTTYGMPLGWNPAIIMYNTKMFKDAGITMNNDWTWDEFREVAKKLTKRDGNNQIYGFALTNSLSQYQVLMSNNECYDMNPDWDQSTWSDPKVAETFQFVYDMLKKDRSIPMIEASLNPSQLFMADRVAMFVTGAWETTTLKNNGFSDWDFADVPTKNGVKGMSYGGDGYCLTSACKTPEYAIDLMRELTGPEIQNMIAELGTSVPSTKEAANSKVFLSHAPHINLIYDGVQNYPYVRLISSPTFLPGIHFEFDKNWAACLADQITIKEMCARMDKYVKDQLAAGR